MPNAIVTAVDANYLPAACCTLLSCAEEGDARDLAKLFLLACDVPTGDVEKARAFFAKHGLSAEIIRIEAERFRPFKVDSYISAATYARLLLPKFFDGRWKRLLYLDADARVMTRLQPLLDANLQGMPVGAVHDYLRYAIYGLEETRTRLSMRTDAPYFNAGVLCFDWRNAIASGLLSRALVFAAENRHLCKSHDQDALNKALEGAWTALDPRWNFMTVAVPDDVFRLYYPARFRPYIAHFAGLLKPWTTNFPKRFEQHGAWYRAVLRDSPWPQFAEPRGTSPASWSFDKKRLKRWLLAQPQNWRAMFERITAMKRAAISHGQAAIRPNSCPTGHPRQDDANPELEALLDRLIAEASGLETRDLP